LFLAFKYSAVESENKVRGGRERAFSSLTSWFYYFLPPLLSITLYSPLPTSLRTLPKQSSYINTY